MHLSWGIKTGGWGKEKRMMSIGFSYLVREQDWDFRFGFVNVTTTLAVPLIQQCWSSIPCIFLYPMAIGTIIDLCCDSIGSIILCLQKLEERDKEIDLGWSQKTWKLLCKRKVRFFYISPWLIPRNVKITLQKKSKVLLYQSMIN
jgi:hypothetical protein